MSEDKQPDSSTAEVSAEKPAAKKQSRAVPVFVAILLAGGLGAYLYVNNQQAPVQEPAPEPEIVALPEPEPEPEPIIVEPEPEPEPVIPDPVKIQFTDLTEKQDLWPEILELTDDIELEIVYNGEIFGQMTFTQGQSIQVSSLDAPASIVGKVGGQQLAVPVLKTNLGSWFESTHAANYILANLDSLSAATETIGNGTSDEEFLEELERWCLLTYGDCRIEIGPDKLILHWKEQQGRVNYAEEAAMLAHHYLKLQAERNQGDNYAHCEIVDLKTGKVLGFNVVFRPAGT